MRARLLCILFTLAVFLPHAKASAQSDTLTFDNVGACVPQCGHGPLVYDGFTFGDTAWHQVYVSRLSDPWGSGATGPLVYGDEGSAIWMALAGGTFDLSSAALAQYLHGGSDSGDATVFSYLTGFRDGQIVYSETLILSVNTPATYQLDWADIDKFEVLGASGGRVMMDNLALTVTPEPSSFALLGTGLLGLGGIVQRQRRKRDRLANA
jgi:hypothetical protein